MNSAKPIIHVVDDDLSFRTAIGELLTAFDFHVILYESAMELLERPPGGGPGCILLDLQMTGLNGIQLQDTLAARAIKLPIIFITGHGDIPTSVQAMKAGAEDFLTKPVSQEKLFEAIARALARHRDGCEQDDKLQLLRALVSQLTPREHEVFMLVVQGRLNKQIANDIGTTERTVKFHRQNIMQKCKAHTLPDLVLMAERLKLL